MVAPRMDRTRSGALRDRSSQHSLTACRGKCLGNSALVASDCGTKSMKWNLSY